MTIIIVILAFFALLMASVIFARINFVLRRERGEKLHVRVYSWFFSIDDGSKRILFFKLKDKPSKLSSKKNADEKSDGKKADDGKKSDGNALSFGEIWAERRLFLRILWCVLKFLRDLLSSFPTDKQNAVHVYVSAAEPDELGLLCAAIYPLIYANSLENTFYFEPDFTIDTYDADVYGYFAVHTSIYRIIFIILLLLYRLPKVAIFKFYRQLQKKKRAKLRNHGSKPSAQ